MMANGDVGESWRASFGSSLGITFGAIALTALLGTQAWAGPLGMGRSGDTSTLLDITLAPSFAVTPIGSSTLGRFSGLDFQPGTGTLFATSGYNGSNPDSLFTIDPATGVATLVGAIGSEFEGVTDLGIDNSGTLFATDFDYLYSINPATGAGTNIGPLFCTALDGLMVTSTPLTNYRELAHFSASSENCPVILLGWASTQLGPSMFRRVEGMGPSIR